MLDYKEIFSKYGLVPPNTDEKTGPNFEIAIPTEQEVEDFTNTFRVFSPIGDEELALHYFSFHLFAQRKSYIYHIADAEKFITSFELDIDQTKIHPELLSIFGVSFPYYDERVKFRLMNYDPKKNLNEASLEKCLNLFSPGYKLQKAFFGDAKEKTIELLEKYILKVLHPSFEESNTSLFLGEMYQYIRQEQEKQANIN